MQISKMLSGRHIQIPRREKMNRLILVAGLVLLLGAGLGWSFLDTQDVQDIDDTAITTTSQKTEPRRAKPIVPERPSAKEPAEKKPTTLPTPKKAYEDWSNLDDSNSQLARVIDRETKEPVADATIAAFTITGPVTENLRKKMLEDIVGFTEENGKLYLSNRAGEVRIPKATTPTIFTASKGERVATRQAYGREKDVIILAIAPRSEIEVKVTSMTGDPLAAISTAVCLQYRIQGGQRIPLLYGTTNDQGLAKISIVPGSIEQFPADQFKLLVAALGVFNPPLEQSIERNDLPSEAVHLRLGPFGNMEVKVLDQDGKPYGQMVSVSFNSATEENKLLFAKTTQNGNVNIPIVSCGLDLKITATPYPGTDLKPVSKSVQSATNPGEKTSITLQFESAWATLKGQLINEAGEPIKDSKIVLQVFADKGQGTRGNSHMCTTTKTGHFEVPLSRGFDSKVFKREVEISTVVRGNTPPLTVRLPMSSETLKDDIDLGTLTLKGPNLLASGHIRDLAGNPIAGAHFDIWNGRDQAPAATTKKIGRPQSDKFGAFQIYGETTASDLRISAYAANHFQERVNVKTGETNVNISLSRVCKIKGRLIMPEGIDGRFFWVVATKDQTHEVQPDGHFELSYLKPGPHKFAVMVRGKPRPYAFEKEVILEGGEIRDLGDIPVQVSGTKLDIVVKSPVFRQRYNGLRIDLFAPGSKKHLAWFSIDEQKDTILMPADVCDIYASKTGFRTELYENVAKGELTIKLKKGIPIRIQVGNKEEIPKGGFINFTAENANPIWYYSPSEAADEKGRIFIMEPGEHKLKAFLKTKIAQRLGTAISITPKTIDVLDSNKEQIFQVRIAQEQGK